MTQKHAVLQPWVPRTLRGPRRAAELRAAPPRSCPPTRSPTGTRRHCPRTAAHHAGRELSSQEPIKCWCELKAKSLPNQMVIIPNGITHGGHFYQYLLLNCIKIGYLIIRKKYAVSMRIQHLIQTKSQRPCVYSHPPYGVSSLPIRGQ